MKLLFQRNGRLPYSWWFASCFAAIILFAGCRKGEEAPRLTITTVATGLVAPLGLEVDNSGNIWVTEGGTGHNDAKVVVIKPNGAKYDAIVNLSSITNESSGELQGAAHLLLDGGTLYVLSGNFLYKANVSRFKPGDKPLDAANIPYEDIAAFVFNYPFVNNAHDSHPYNLTKGPDGDLYISDAGANAIIHRKRAGVYSILAELPGIMNPTPVGPPQIQAVPTSIRFDGRDFLVTTLLGFPFPQGHAMIYKVTKQGAVSIYQGGFTTLVDQAEGNGFGHVVVQYGIFSPDVAFHPNTGALIWANGSTSEQLTGNLNMPTSIKQVNSHTWYVVVMGDGSVIKVTYR